MNQTKTTAGDFFIYFGILIGLYASTISLLSVIFSLINKWLPDTTMNYYLGNYEDSSIRFALSVLIIFFPAFIYLSRLATKALTVSPEKKEMWVRRWFYFLTLFLTGLAMAIDLSFLVYSFIGGDDLTLRFVLKVLAVFLVTLGIFRFYFYELKRDVTVATPKRKYLMYGVVTLFVIVVVTALVSVGSPAKQRKLNQDIQRVSDLSQINNEINAYFERNSALPNNLNDLTKTGGYYVPNLKDQVTQKDYEYIVIDKQNYKLCAEFVLPNPETRQTNIWKHEAGRTCFERSVK